MKRGSSQSKEVQRRETSTQAAHAAAALGFTLGLVALWNQVLTTGVDPPPTAFAAVALGLTVLLSVGGLIVGARPRSGPPQQPMIAASSIGAILCLTIAAVEAVEEIRNPWVLAVFAALLLTALFFYHATRLSQRSKPPQRGLLRLNASITKTTAAVCLPGILVATFPGMRSAALFGISAAALACAAALLGFIPRQQADEPFTRPTNEKTGLAFFARYCRTHRRVAEVVALLSLHAGASIAAVGIVVTASGLMPVDDGWNLAVMFVLGVFVGASFIVWMSDGLQGPWTITLAVIGSAVCVLMIAVVASPGGMMAACFLAGACACGVNVGGCTMLQRLVPRSYLWPVVGVAGVMAATGACLGAAAVSLAPVGWVVWHPGEALLVPAAILVIAGSVAIQVHRSRSSLSAFLAAYRHVTEFICRFWYRLERQGPCTIPAQGPVIVTANHTSGIDPYLLAIASPRRILAFMVAREYYLLPIAHYLMKIVECIPVRRDGQDIAATKAAMRHLRDGKALGIFIEGRIALPGETLEPKEGVAVLALRTKATVIPAFISGTVYRDSVLLSFLLRHRARVRYGPPVDLSEFHDCDLDREAYKTAARKIMQAIRALGEEQDRDDCSGAPA